MARGPGGGRPPYRCSRVAPLALGRIRDAILLQPKLPVAREADRAVRSFLVRGHRKDEGLPLRGKLASVESDHPNVDREAPFA